MNNKKPAAWLPLMFSLFLVIGMFLGYKFSREMPNGNFYKKNNGTPLQEAIDIIRTRYVDSVDVDSLEQNALKSMMGMLDPHSAYFSPEGLKEANDDISGNFQGIGVEFNQLKDTVNVTYIIAGGPSDKAGLQVGDQIIKVNDTTIAGKKLTTTQIRSLIRGESGSKVALLLLRNGKAVNAVVTRGLIPTPSVTAAYMMDAATGFIKLDRFTATSYRECAALLDSFTKKGMNALILDLRGNGGGLMDQAVELADEFLSNDKLIVYTEGAKSPKKEFRCRRPGLFEKGKLTILVDELTASASEILCGAIQDWDRGTIIGRRTFGKGLVQEPFTLSDGSGLRLTIARYYTPLGRSIQRSYAGGKKVYMDEVWQRFANGEAYVADSNKINTGKKFTTPSGRVLYGGGGIMPDVFVGLDTSNVTKSINKLLYNGSFNDFVFHYYLSNRALLQPYTSPLQFEQAFDAEKQLWPRFVEWARRDTVQAAGVTIQEKQRLENRMEAYLARFKWRDNGYYQVLNSKDPVVAKAIEILKK